MITGCADVNRNRGIDIMTHKLILGKHISATEYVLPGGT